MVRSGAERNVGDAGRRMFAEKMSYIKKLKESDGDTNHWRKHAVVSCPTSKAGTVRGYGSALLGVKVDLEARNDRLAVRVHNRHNLLQSCMGFRSQLTTGISSVALNEDRKAAKHPNPGNKRPGHDLYSKSLELNFMGPLSLQVKDSVMSSLGQTARKEGQSIYRHPRSASCMQFEAALPLVTEAALSEQRTSVGEHDRPINDTGLSQEVEKQEDAEMLAVELHARNSTFANGTSSFEVFEASQTAVEPLPTAPSTGELERD